MATAPPPPPPPSSLGIQLKETSPPPCPAHAALPFFFNDSPAIQETSPSPDPDAPVAVLPSPQSAQNGHQSSLLQGEDDNLSDDKYHPVQETDPAPQALNGQQASTVQLPAETRVQDEVANRMNQGGEDHLA